MTRVLVIGAGLAGLISAIRLARGGAEVTLVAKGLGGLPISPGVIDVWGYQMDETARTQRDLRDDPPVRLGVELVDQSHLSDERVTAEAPAAPGAQAANRRAVLVGGGPGQASTLPPARNSVPPPLWTPVVDPVAAVSAAPDWHPYSVIGVDAVRAGLELLSALSDGLLVGEPNKNLWLPTAVGALRPTCLAQVSMSTPDLLEPVNSRKRDKLASSSSESPDSTDFEHLGTSLSHNLSGRPLAIVGLRRLKDFNPALIAGNLARTPLPDGTRLTARPLMIDVPARPGEADSSALTYARAFDEPGFALRVAAALRPLLDDGEAVGFPAVLGLHDREVWRTLADELGHPVFEIPLPPPSVPGLRLNDTLTAAAKAAGVRFVLGSAVVGLQTDADRVTSVTLDTAGHPTRLTADAYVLATGGFESGGLALDSHGTLTEPTFNLPVWTERHAARSRSSHASGGSCGFAQDDGKAETHNGSFNDDPWAPQPLFASGLRVDTAMRPLDAAGRPVHTNVHAAGGLLAGAQRWLELSGDGIALGSAIAAADAIGDTR